MTDCCQNTITPRMIKAGQVSVGDRSSFEEDEAILTHGPAPIQGQPTPRQVNTHTNQWQNNEVKRILPYEEMTAYMNNVSQSGTMENPSVILPQSPLAPGNYQEEIDSTALQSFNGFLRTQIGRYMRVQQLVTSDRTEDRLGFLVGVGSNFIILQDITTGNILVIDIFSIRLTYVYYSPAVVPEF